MKITNAGDRTKIFFLIYITSFLGKELRKTLKKINTPQRNQIKGIDLCATKKKMKTPLKQDIEKGVQLKLTKKKLKTPLRKEIQNGKRLRETNPKSKTSLKDRDVLQPKSNRVKGQYDVDNFGDSIEYLRINERHILKAKRRCETAGIPSLGFNMVTFSGSDSKVFFLFS